VCLDELNARELSKPRNAAVDSIGVHLPPRQKNGRQDIEKAMHYLQLLLEMDYDAQDHNVLVCGRCGELKDSENHACVGTDSFGVGGPTWRGPR
jgi:hypothetical protein